jgi:hypothetical protein
MTEAATLMAGALRRTCRSLPSPDRQTLPGYGFVSFAPNAFTLA